MESIQKISYRFYNDHEVRAVWNDEEHKWFFPAVDIIAAITGSEAPRKYWSVLKTRLKKQGDELATNCSQLKIRAVDGNLHEITPQLGEQLPVNLFLVVFPMPVHNSQNCENGCENGCEIQLTARQKVVLEMIVANGYETARHIASVLDVGQRSVESDISVLRKNGFIDKADKNNRSPWVVLKSNVGKEG